MSDSYFFSGTPIPDIVIMTDLGYDMNPKNMNPWKTDQIYLSIWSIYQWLNARLQYLQCISNRYATLVHQAVDIE